MCLSGLEEGGARGVVGGEEEEEAEEGEGEGELFVAQREGRRRFAGRAGLEKFFWR